jgi:hypothetical protein
MMTSLIAHHVVVDELRLHFYPTLACELAISVSIPVFFCNRYCYVGPCHARIATVAYYEESRFRSTTYPR